MIMSDDTTKVYNFLSRCPECGNTLEIHPASGWKACFLHGDFQIVDDRIAWNYTKHLYR